MDFVERVSTATAILTEGAIVTRLVYEFGLSVPDSASFVHLFQDDGRRALRAVYESYMTIAAQYGIPMQVGTATWRAHSDGLVKQGWIAPGDLRTVNREAVVFLQDLRRSLKLEGTVYIAGVIGPRVDGYDSAGAPNAEDASAYHAAQADVFAQSGVDVLYAPTFASTEELLGLSRACAATTLPYVVAPIINAHGFLPDGVSLADAVARIDAGVSRPPIHFQIGCVHPSHYLHASTHMTWPNSGRVVGLQANASTLSPSELENLSHAAGDDAEAFADHMMTLHRHGAKILGGCCGTSDAHIRALARRLATASD